MVAYMQMENMQSNISTEAEAPFVEDYLLYVLAQASAAASAAFHAQLAEQGVSVGTWRILASLYPDRTRNVGELAKSCLTKQPTLTRQLDRLCAQGWTERAHQSEDRRGVIIRLTPEGQARSADYVAMAKAHERQVLSDYSDDEAAGLKEALRQLILRSAPMSSGG